MKRVSLSSVPLAALITANWLSVLSISHAEKAGINIQDDWSDGGGAAVTETSFGVPAANWINLPRVTNSIAGAFSSSTTVTLPGAGPIKIDWSAGNTYSLTGAVPETAGADPGADQVVYGYLDDTGTGYRLKISGLRNSVSDYKITLIASTDGGTGFTNANVAHSSGTDVLTYGSTVPALGGGIYAITPETPLISATTENNTLTFTGVARDGSNRSTLAGILLEYTPSTTNVPVIEVPPVAPTGTIYQSQSFTLNVEASGSNLSYQWRKGGVPITGNATASTPSLTVSAALLTDSGSYDVVVSGVGSPATSTPVSITITPLQQPVFTQTPVAQNFYVGYPATFTALASGGEITYTWKKGTTTVGTGSSFTLPAIAAADAGTYTVTASNLIGEVTTSTTLAVKTPVPGTYEAVQAGQKPLLWFRYNETALPQVNTSTVANSGSLGGSVIGQAKRYIDFQQPGALVGDATNKGASFKTNSQFIDIPYTPDLNTTSFTAEMWIKPPPTNNGRFDPLCNRGAAAGDGFLFFGWNGSTKWQFRTYVGSAVADRTNINSLVDIVPGKWTHLVGTYDAATNTQRLYVDGVEQGSGANPTSGYVPNSAMPMRLIGFPNDNGDVGGGSFAGGALDEVAIYPTALSAAQVLAHYQNGTNASRATPYATLVQADGPTAYFRLNDPAGPVPPAPLNSGTAGTAFNGLYGGDLLPVSTGPTAPEDPGFESPNNAVGTTLNGYNVVQPLGITTNTLTVTTWLKRSTNFTTDDLSWPGWLGAGGGFHMDGTGGRPYGELRYHWDGGQWGWGSGLQVPAETWTFCALVLEPTRATVYMGDGNSLRKSSVAATHTPHLLNQAMGFGGNQAGRVSRNYVGQLDESAFYNRALSETELLSLFVTGSGAPMELNIAAGGVLNDTKPAGTPLDGLNFGSSWEASSTDNLSSTRTGVQTFEQEPGDQIQVPASTELNNPTGTIMFWMKAGLPAGPGSTASMLFDWRTTNGTVITLADAGNLFIQCANSANTFSDTYTVSDELWHHVAVTYNQDAAGSIAVYIDGVLSSEGPNSAAWSWPAGVQPVIGKSRDPFWRRFNGQLDDFRIYSQILSPAEITQIKNTGAVVVPSTLKLRYDFATAGSGLTLSWPFGILESSTTMQANDPWTPVPNATSPFPIAPTGPAKFFRARLPQ